MGETIGGRIKRLRERRGWTQEQLAEKVKMNNSVLSRVESDKRPVESRELAAFADVFEVDSDYLLGRDKVNDSEPLEERVTRKTLEAWSKKYNIDLTNEADRDKLEQIIRLFFEDSKK